MSEVEVTLRVVGRNPVDGHETGATFRRVIGAREQTLIEGGHLAIESAPAHEVAEREVVEPKKEKRG